MSRRRRGLRAELSAILLVDQYTQQNQSESVNPPGENVSMHLSDLITHATTHPDEARTVYAYLPSIMLRLFGFSPGQGWLETCSDLVTRDRDAIVALAMPNGPIHAFCREHTLPRNAPVSHGDMRFEFSRRNLPHLTDAALELGNVAPQISLSYLARMLLPTLRTKEDGADVLLLSPLDYFFLCLVASPTRKPAGKPESDAPLSKAKRSRSLPSTRAQYNHVIAAYAASLNPAEGVHIDDIFIPACLDYFFIPFAAAASSNHLPPLSTCTADAVASLLLTLVPPSPDALQLHLDAMLVPSPLLVDLHLLTNSSALYRLTGRMLHCIFKKCKTSLSHLTLTSYLRILALYLAPWRANVRKSIRSMLFAKAKSSSSRTSARSPSIYALSSTLSSINAHLSSPSGSPGNASTVREGKWCAELRNRQRDSDKDLLRLAIVLAANQHLGEFVESSRVLQMLAEAAQTARLSKIPFKESDQFQTEELQMCLSALRDQNLEMQRKVGRRERNYMTILANNVGQGSVHGGMLSGISEMVGVGSGDRMSGMVLSRSSGGSSCTSRRRVHERRSMTMKSGLAEDVPFLGSVWDRPIAKGESETLVLGAYWLALRLEPYLGFVPDTRFLGQYWVWVFLSLFIAFSLGLRACL